jgi:hydrogenase nickel incorporation protein HypA/HybF
MLTSLDPALVGAQLVIDRVPHRARCHHCAREFPVTNFVTQCPTCQEWDTEVVSGTELQIIEMEIEAGSITNE